MKSSSNNFNQDAGRGRRKVVFTFDDIPLQPSPPDNETMPRVEVLQQITAKLLKTLKDNRIPAIGFINEKRLNSYVGRAKLSVLEMWLDAGFELGNHTYSHVAPESTPLSDYLKDILRGEYLLRPLLEKRGKRLRYFRHPQLHTGPDLEYKRALDRFLIEHGYTICPVTIKHQGWLFAVVYAVARLRDDRATMKLVTDAYIAYIEECFEFFENISVELVGREISQILLLHANELNSDYGGELADMLKGRGYEFIPLEEALKDAAYLLPDNYAGPKGPSWFHRWAFTMGRHLPPEPKEPAFIRELFTKITEQSRGSSVGK